MAQHIERLFRNHVIAWLRSHGVTESNEFDEVLDGFDFTQPVYEQQLSRGDRVYQYSHRPSSTNVVPAIGKWFCLSGATPSSLAIIHGGSGRHLQHFVVQERILVLEGIARRQKRNWSWSGGGVGGGTQIYVPPPNRRWLLCTGTET